MNKFILTGIIATLFCLYQTTQNTMIHSDPGGAPTQSGKGYTGSPFDNRSCNASGCHTGSATVPQTGWITTDIPVEGYTPGTIYNITVTGSLSGINRFGFQATCQNATGSLLGTLIAGSSTSLVGSGKYVTHKLSSIDATNNTKVWQFQWEAPVTGTGDVTFYASVLATNKDGQKTGDVAHTTSLTIVENSTAGIAEKNNPSALRIYPSPASDYVNIVRESGSESGIAYFYHIDGQLVHQSFVEQGINQILLPEGMLNGTYVIVLKTKSNASVSRMLVSRN